MTYADEWPQQGDAAVELHRANRSPDADQVGRPITVKTVTDSLVITSNGEKYNRETLKPTSEGRYSARELARIGDVRVLVAQGRAELDILAQMARNLADIDYRKPEDIATAFARIVTYSAICRERLVVLMAEASRQEQESKR